ncbi:MAG TPA: hypothetical protein VHY84_22235 [Bryobacteraceae bacterium]|jgi:hypothetical protein|nr:hypothetical protein [Bryobacteraceae bacterium]
MRLSAAVSLLLLFSGLAAAQTCDRPCLNGFVDQYLDAMVKHDTKLVPLTRNVKFTENGQRLDPGDGLWHSMAAKGAYRLFVTDVQAGEVAFLGTIREQGRKAGEQVADVIAMRLKVVNRQIPEVETLVVRNERSAQNFEKLGTPNHLFQEAVPPAERMSRDDLVKTANMYFTGMQQNDGKGVYPFTDDCNRIENGSPTTNVPPADGKPIPDPRTATNYSAAWSCKQQFESGLLHFVTRIRDRRFVAVDPERGMVFSFIFFDHSAGSTRTFQTPDGRTVTAGPNQPWTWELAELFKVEKGKLHQIEAVMDHSPYGMNSGWSNWEDGMSSRARDITK